jgi:transposase-like protein
VYSNVIDIVVPQVYKRVNSMRIEPPLAVFHSHKEMTIPMCSRSKRLRIGGAYCSLGSARTLHYNKDTTATSSSSARKAILACLVASLPTTVAIDERRPHLNGSERFNHGMFHVTGTASQETPLIRYRVLSSKSTARIQSGLSIAIIVLASTCRYKEADARSSKWLGSQRCP